MRRSRTNFALAALALACGPSTQATGGGESGASVESGSSTQDTSTATTSTTTGTASWGETTTDNPGDTSDSSPHGTGFLSPLDFGDASSCDMWAQNCPAGHKCMPWANDGSSSWNDTRCSPIDPDAVGVGEVCTVVGSGVSGVDTCDRGSMCWDIDPDTEAGRCVAFCRGAESAPVCDDPTAWCSIPGNAVTILCLPWCDPLAQDCDAGSACYPLGDFFRCGPDAGGEMGAFGDACAFINVCDPGLFCASPDDVPGCNAEGCCSAFCDLEDPDGSCPGAAGGQQCVPWHDEGEGPPSLAAVGACIIPP